jgi:hypothetical protein
VKLSRWVFAFILTLILPGTFLAHAREDASKVDSGSFGVFMNGHRVGTETFSITQNANGSVIQSEFKADGSAGQATQNSEMQLTAGGEIRRYEWKELSPGKAQSVIVPNDQFLTQKWSANPQEKTQEQPYLLPASTSILDDYFFVHREVMAWKYLSSACTREKEGLRCPRAQFGTMNPRQHASAPATMEYLGRDKVSIHGAEQELNKLELKSETGTWQLWLDDQFKLLRIFIPAENTEVVRD